MCFSKTDIALAQYLNLTPYPKPEKVTQKKWFNYTVHNDKKKKNDANFYKKYIFGIILTYWIQNQIISCNFGRMSKFFLIWIWNVLYFNSNYVSLYIVKWQSDPITNLSNQIEAKQATCTLKTFSSFFILSKSKATQK